MRRLGLILLFSAVLGSTLAQESSWSPAQKEVWNREETYWQLVVARDAKAYLDLWDESFVGWPSFEKSPVNKDSFRQNPFGVTIRNVTGYQFEHKSVQLHGETAIAFLQVRVIQGQNAESSQRVIRLTHTWQKRDGVWRIVGGMSCVVKPDGLC